MIAKLNEFKIQLKCKVDICINNLECIKTNMSYMCYICWEICAKKIQQTNRTLPTQRKKLLLKEEWP